MLGKKSLCLKVVDMAYRQKKRTFLNGFGLNQNLRLSAVLPASLHLLVLDETVYPG